MSNFLPYAICSNLKGTTKKLSGADRARSWRFAMRHSSTLRLILALALITTLFVGCSRDPNVRKQKYFESGQRYFDKGQYREAAIQYANAVQIDPRFAQAHFQLR